MKGAQKRDCTAQLSLCRSLRIQTVLKTVSARRLVNRKSSFASNACLIKVAQRYHEQTSDYYNYLDRRMRIDNADFLFNFNRFSDGECMVHFRLKKKDVKRMIPFLGWPLSKTATHRNRYSVSPILAGCIMLCRLASPARWKDIEEFFEKYAPQLSEIFWEAIEHLLQSSWHLLSGPISEDFMANRAEMYAEAVFSKNNAFPNCVGFIGGTVLGIALPKGNLPQRVVYNGHKRKHALKFQVFNTPDGLIQHAYGSVEGRWHDWTLYLRSCLYERLLTVLSADGRLYCIYGDSGYNARWFMEVPFQGSNLTAAQKAFNRSMSSARVTVEWILKDIKMHFSTVDFKRKMKVLEAPVGKLYPASMVLSNFRNFIYPNQVARHFICSPLSLEEYVGHKD